MLEDCERSGAGPSGRSHPDAARREPVDCPSGGRHEGGVSPLQALVRNVGTYRLDEGPSVGSTVRCAVALCRFAAARRDPGGADEGHAARRSRESAAGRPTACGRARLDIKPIRRHCQYCHGRQTLLIRLFRLSVVSCETTVPPWRRTPGTLWVYSNAIRRHAKPTSRDGVNSL